MVIDGYKDPWRFRPEHTKPLQGFVRWMKQVGFVTFSSVLYREYTDSDGIKKLCKYHEEDLIYKYRQGQHGLVYAELTPEGLEAVKFMLEAGDRSVRDMNRLYKMKRELKERYVESIC